jgi:DNA-binding beta-propeller fold protein YncE
MTQVDVEVGGAAGASGSSAPLDARSWRCAPLALAAIAAGIVISTPAEAATSTPLFAFDEVEEVRSIAAADLGIARLEGLAFSWRDRSLLVADARRGHTRVLRLSLFERRRGSMRLPRLSRPSTLSFDRASGRLTAVGRKASVTVAAGRRAGRRPAVQRADASRLGLRDPRGATFDRAGETWFILDTGANEIVRVPVRRGSPARTARISLDRLGERPRGIAFNPHDRRLYLLSSDERRIFALDRSGKVLDTHDLGSLMLGDPKAMVFAPSGDPTDDPANLHLYIADGGGPSRRGGIVETDLVPGVALAAAAVEHVPVTLVQTLHTSRFSPPSPDPAGIVYVPDTDRFIISDSEVDEMSIYQGANLFAATRTGSGSRTGTTLAFSNEPTGLGYRAADRTLFVSDDEADRINIVRPGADGAYGTADDVRSRFSTLTFNGTDPESVEYDAATGHVFICDGTGREVYRVDPVDAAFGDGDDVVTHFDIETYGAKDCEGMAIDPERNTLLAVDPSSKKIYELSKTGALTRVLDLSTIPVTNKLPSSVTMAPTSNPNDSPSKLGYWITDRQVDNGTDPNESDGKFYEVSIPSTDAPPTVIVDQPPVMPAEPDQDAQTSCVRSKRVQRLVFSASKYPNIRAHFRAAISNGWPRRLVLNRRGAVARRDRLLKTYPQRNGYGRNQYPPAVGRGRGKGLERGQHPRGWQADVRYVPSTENRSHRVLRRRMLSRFCDGTAFRYVFR